MSFVCAGGTYKVLALPILSTLSLCHITYFSHTAVKQLLEVFKGIFWLLSSMLHEWNEAVCRIKRWEIISDLRNIMAITSLNSFCYTRNFYWHYDLSESSLLVLQFLKNVFLTETSVLIALIDWLGSALTIGENTMCFVKPKQTLSKLRLFCQFMLILF